MNWYRIGYEAGRNPSVLLVWLGTPVFFVGLGMWLVMAMESFIERHGYTQSVCVTIMGIGLALFFMGKAGRK